MRLICAFLICLIALSSVGTGQSLPGGSNRVPQKGLSKPGGPSIVPRAPNRIPQRGWSAPKVPSIVPRRPTIVPIPPTAKPGGKSCPEGQVRKRKRCVDRDDGRPGLIPPAVISGGKTCPEGQVRKRKRCVDRDDGRPGLIPPAVISDGKPCPEGYERKRRRCVKAPGAPVEAGSPTPAAPKPTVPTSAEPKPAEPKPAEPKPTTPKVEQAAPAPPPVPPLPDRKQIDPIPPTIAALIAGRPHRPLEILVLVDATNADAISARLAQEQDLAADPPVQLVLLDAALVRFTFEGDRSIESVLAALNADPDVDLIQPNYDYRASKEPALPSHVPQYAGEAIRLGDAHRLARGQGVMVAVIDTAIDETHPELAGAIADVFDAIGEGQSRPELHGTEIAGILRSRAKLTGVAPDAKLLSVRAFRRSDVAGPAQSTSLRLLKGIDWAFDTGARVMNMSFTGPLDPLLEGIVTAATEKGVIFVAAAGNDGPEAPPVYPAAYPKVIAVTATDSKDRLYAKANHGDYIAIAAPGVDIVVPALKGRYGLSSGTSMAAAHVSGVVALLLERDAGLSAAEISTILASSAREPLEPLEDVVIGAGILDAAGAVDRSGKVDEGAPSEAGVSAGP